MSSFVPVLEEEQGDIQCRLRGSRCGRALRGDLKGPPVLRPRMFALLLVGHILFGFAIGGGRRVEAAHLKKINPWQGSVPFNLLFKQPKASHCGVYIFSEWKSHEDSQIYSTQELGNPLVLNMGRKG